MTKLDPWQREMIRGLFPYSGGRLRIEEAFATKFPHIPAKLYKYRDFSNSYHKQALECDQQWFSSPDNFNDPFDTVANFKSDKLPRQRQTLEECLAEVELIRATEAKGGKWIASPITDPISVEQWRKEVLEPLTLQLPKEHQDIFRAMLRSSNEDLNDELVSGTSAFLRNGFSALSLSADPTSNLMWSHYSASHKGFCIEYDFGSLPYSDLRKRMCFPVFYRKKRTDSTRYFSQARADFNPAVGIYLCLMKGAEWSYEQEWRIVHAIGPADANRLYAMPPPSALIVGACVGTADLEYAQSFCHSRAIPLRQARLKSDSLSVTVSELS
ncbi:DUF2971 domain-containing protein [Sphingopyxis sp.]|jgi:hypothetical protein|uniref:DUF2971 domain-containing protein n=1 Tax=Sphingopyxis sp. TaxID=1908224 RepID=UPI002DF47AF6|nr:DUF2971 domain-containing protein [Sphingopyxis sp.]